jgi:hypothetical protein
MTHVYGSLGEFELPHAPRRHVGRIVAIVSVLILLLLALGATAVVGVAEHSRIDKLRHERSNLERANGRLTQRLAKASTRLQKQGAAIQVLKGELTQANKKLKKAQADIAAAATAATGQFIEGYSRGQSEGTGAGYDAGYGDGYDAGTRDGYDAGYNDGYDTGYGAY